ncbi:hypothetical protein Noda2021_09560 [Candidatus Dependentiae bacterium Noda2021]|nr:hypothetical protein Noda2021_09560 [Candidatus Dependentiae bacterium Noda2021]
MNKALLLALLFTFNQTLTMLIPLYLPSIESHRNSVPNKSSRKWLNWIYDQNNLIVTHQEVRANIDYYHEMIQKHYQHLLYKKEHATTIKKIKFNIVKFCFLTTCVSAGITLASITDKFNKIMGLFCLAGIPLGLMSLSGGIAFLRSYIKYDYTNAKNIQRDLDMLKQFEEYKAAK